MSTIDHLREQTIKKIVTNRKQFLNEKRPANSGIGSGFGADNYFSGGIAGVDPADAAGQSVRSHDNAQQQYQFKIDQKNTINSFLKNILKKLLDKSASQGGYRAGGPSLPSDFPGPGDIIPGDIEVIIDPKTGDIVVRRKPERPRLLPTGRIPEIPFERWWQTHPNPRFNDRHDLPWSTPGAPRYIA